MQKIITRALKERAEVALTYFLNIYLPNNFSSQNCHLENEIKLPADKKRYKQIEILHFFPIRHNFAN